MNIAKYLVVVAILSFHSTSAFAAAKANAAVRDEQFPRLLSARELLSLGPVLRMRYIQSVRTLFNELDRQAYLGRGRLISESGVEPKTRTIAKYSAAYELFALVVPEAQAAECTDSRYPFSVGGLCGARCEHRPIANDETGRAVGPAGGNSRNAYFCFPRTAYAEWAKQQGGDSITTIPRMTDEEYRKANLEGPPSETLPKIAEMQRQQEAAVIETEKKKAEAEEAARIAAAKAAPGGTQPSSGDKPLPEKGKGEGVCAPTRMSCEKRDEFIKQNHGKALKDFRASKPVNCISSGNISKYKDNKVKAGNCEIVRDFCMRKEDCTKTAAAVDGGFQSRYSCPAGKSICTPFIYGLKDKQSAICVPERGKHLTEACDTEATKLEKAGGGYVKDFLKDAPAGVAEAWDEYADGFNSACRQKSEAQAAHCLECGIISARLKAARALASGSCDDALAFKQLRPGSAAPAETSK